ncbi:MAG: tRNA threonylcarbamoyladenosine dehydratase [Clostridia bacterium]|nr:tRNA threonylcarbamoyladenosine dehydratase [Clostridia bacterium]
MNQFSRTELLLGPEAMETLKQSRIAVFGVGGVGSYVVEALVRSGVGSLDLVDHDRVSLTNLNRQLIASHSTLGRDKVEVAMERALDINPLCRIRPLRIFYLPETRHLIDFTQYDYVIDAIDTVSGKLSLIQAAQEAGTPIISAMGTGNKTDPTAFRVADLYETSVCPLARVMRKECRKRGIRHLKVVYSTEEPLHPSRPADMPEDDPPVQTGARPKDIPGSAAFVPSVAGLILAGAVIMDLIRKG